MKERNNITIDTSTCLMYIDNMFPENVERNKRLVKDRQATSPPMTWEKLAEIYGISPTQAKRLYEKHASKYQEK